MQNTVKLTNVAYNAQNELCATLTNGTVAVRCDDVLYLDFVNYAAMCAVYTEWCELATANEAGYYFVAA
jgi:hypothetical protein